ncbi:MAG: hypothetical protein JSR44_12640 [Spirochaetes bacterium]|nr:hypothetical protein [Spirochaetota bacterium]
MRAYDFSTHNKTVKRDRSRYFTYAFISLLIAALGAFLYYVVLNSPRILFYFRDNKYSEIERLHTKAVEAVRSAPVETAALGKDSLGDVSEFLDLAHSLQKDHREDAILYFHEATVLAEAVRKQVHDRSPALITLLFRDFIGRPQFLSEFDQELWQRALLAGRRARAFGLPDLLQQNLAEAEIEVYLLGGRPWWESARDLVQTNAAARKLPAWHLMQAALARETPDFELVKTAYGPTLATFARGVYYARSGNSPLSSSNFRDLAKSQTDAVARDYALYVLGFLSGKEKRVRDQLSYYKQIRFAEFAPRNQYFVSEYNYLLRFLGQKSEADQMMHAWEEMKAQKNE